MWEEGFRQLCRYVETHGKARIPPRATFEGFKLGIWVANQRTRRSRLNGDQQQRLESLPGWSWDPLGDQWEETFSQLLRYVEKHGDARVPRTYTVDGIRLGDWVVTQRQSYAKGRLDPDRERRLQDLTGWIW